jgi:hypothetical protein
MFESVTDISQVLFHVGSKDSRPLTSDSWLIDKNEMALIFVAENACKFSGT